MTELLFRDDAYAREATATVVAATPEGIVLDRTVFYATAGGQPGDTGTIRWKGGEAAVAEARKGAAPDEVRHLVADGAALPAPGTPVALALDWPAFDPDAAVAALRRKRTGVKRALLDQTLVSGVGNIYADESLWRTKLHWARPTEKLTKAQAGALLAAATDVMTEALAAGGTSFDALYVNVNGQSGYFDRALAVYGQEGKACRRCGSVIRRDPFMNRSSYSCPKCQPMPKNPHV